MGKLNVAIADDNEVMRDLLEEMVTSDDELHLIGMAKDGEEACHLIREKEPDVVLLDIIMPKLDGLAVLDRIRADHTLKNRPTFLMISGISNEKITEDAFERGADYYIMKPFDRNIVLDRIKTLNRRKNKVRKEIGRPVEMEKKPEKYSLQTLEEDVTEIIHEVGVPAHIKGYQFLKEAIKLVIKKPEIINSITKQLYPSIARNFETSPSKVERAIRHAIEVAWNRGRIENLNTIFGYNIYTKNDKPTNGEFIALIADRLMLEESA